MTTPHDRLRAVRPALATGLLAAVLAAGGSAAAAGDAPEQAGPGHAGTSEATAAERLQVGFNGRSEQIAMIDHFYTPDADHGPRLVDGAVPAE